jgi:hypothetical protein
MSQTLKLAILRGPKKGILVSFNEADQALSLAHSLFMDLYKDMTEQGQKEVQPRHFVKNFWKAYAAAEAVEAVKATSQHMLCYASGFHFLLLINMDKPTVKDFDNHYILMTPTEARVWYRVEGYGIPIITLGGGLFKLTEEAATAAVRIGLKLALV